MKRYIFLALILAGVCPAEVLLKPGTPILMDPNEPGPIRKAVNDLSADLEAVFRQSPRIVRSAEEAGPVAIVVAFERNLPGAVQKPAGWEKLRIQVVSNPWPGSPVKKAIVLTGSDVRGTIYAVYEFSKQVLDVEPFHWWTDRKPAVRRQIPVADNFTVNQGPPTFRYRGWFMNDEDLMTLWRPGTKDGTGIALDLWERVYEAILRLHGNMVIPGTFLFPDEPQMKTAVERGLILSQHHMEPLGLNVYQWPDGVPFNLERLITGWRCAVRQFPAGAEMVWTVGLRGRYDNPFWMDAGEAAKTDEGQGRIIRTAIEKQMEIVRQAFPGTNPDFIMNSWMEGSRLVRQGALKIPEGVHVVWADDGAGNIQDRGSIAAGNGVYYHTAVVGGNANNFTERVPVGRIEKELGRAVRAGATHYLLVNPSDIQPVSMTTRAVMEMAWNAEGWTGSKYLRDWAREEFGEKAAPVVARYYDAYFEAPTRFANRDNLTMADNLYQQRARDLLLRIGDVLDKPAYVVEGDASATVQTKKLGTSYEEYVKGTRRGCDEAEARWAAAAKIAEEAAPLVLPERREFFRGHVLQQLAIHRHSNAMLGAVAEAALPGIDAKARLKALKQAIAAEQKVLEAMKEAGYGKWQGFYTKGDLFVNVPLTMSLAKAVEKKVSGGSFNDEDRKTIELANHYINKNSAIVYKTLKAYHGNRKLDFCGQ